MNNTKQNVPFDLIEEEIFERKKYEGMFGKKMNDYSSINYTTQMPKSETISVKDNGSYKTDVYLYELTYVYIYTGKLLLFRNYIKILGR